jgi:integrase
MWEADFMDAQGNRHRPTAKTKREAENLLEDGIAEKKRAQERKHGTPLADDPMTFPRYVDRWLSMLTVEKKTLAGYSQYARLYITPTITKKVGSITPADVNDLLAKLRRQYAPATVRQAKSVLTQVLSLAVLEGYLAANPVASVQRVRSKKAKPKVRAMTREQRDRLLNETPEPYRALFALMAFSGLRPGEAYALKPSDLDLEMGIVRVERSVSIHDQSIKGTKTNEERDVELSDQTVAGMKTHLWLNDTVIRESGYLFSSEAGSILDHNNVAASIALGVSLMRNGRHR